jgi:hypothetical protein
LWDVGLWIEKGILTAGKESREVVDGRERRK